MGEVVRLRAQCSALALALTVGSMRFPAYFVLNLSVERRFTFLGYQLAMRAGLDNITNRHNPFSVDNNIDSPHFLTYGGLQGRALTARVRVLGRK